MIGFHESGVPSQVFADCIIDADLPVLGEQHDARGDELLADRCDFVDGFGCRRDSALAIRNAVPCGLDNLTVL